MEKVDFKVRDYLKKHGARGKSNAVSGGCLSSALLGNSSEGARRTLRDMVTEECMAGALICSSTTKPVGYYLPSSLEEVREELSKWETSIKIRAARARPFREFVGRVKSHKLALAEGKNLFPDMVEDMPRAVPDTIPTRTEPKKSRVQTAGRKPSNAEIWEAMQRAARPDLYAPKEHED